VQGVLLGNYRVLEQIGEGGMGVVYLARHEQLGHHAAAKVLRLERSRDADMVQRFFNEAQAATAIRHPGIVQIFDVGVAPDGQAYFVMELLEGQSLTALLARRRLDPVACCRIGRQIANVLQAAHAAGITHRDLKPDNLFLVPDAEVIGGERVKVLDFGIAKLAGELPASTQTRTGLVMGTPNYMSPEQCRSVRAADARSDIYSLGCILFEMACGRLPFLSESAMELIGAHVHVTPPHPQNLAPNLPPELSALIAKMLSKHPDARPQTMTAIGRTLDEILRTLEEARAPTSPPVRAPTTTPAPKLSTSATTLGGAAGASIARMLAAGRQRPLLLGGLVLAAAVVAILLALVIGGSGAPALQPLEVAPPKPPPTPAPPPPPAPIPADADADAEADADSAADDLAAECRGYQVDRSWDQLARCADQLQPLDPARAAKLKALAEQGAASAPQATPAAPAPRDPKTP
jgi:eukaryotic-like serine/threonine-protein kinase